jgi:hypothetical protein
MKKSLLSLTFGLFSLVTFSQGGLTCASAVNITANGTYVIGTITGTKSTGTGTCFTTSSTSPNSMWYKFTPSSSGVMSISSDIAANPADADTRLSVHTAVTACTDPWVCVASNDDVDATNFRSALSNVTVTAGTTYYIEWDDRWENVGGSFTFTFTGQSCFIPSGFTFLGPPTTTTASIGWTAPTSGTTPVGYVFEYGPQGFTQGTGTTINTTTNSAALTNLNPSTVYSFYVRSNCGAGDFSLWSNAISFNTVFEPTNPTYSTGFENSSFPFIGWLAATPVAGSLWGVNAAVSGDPTVYAGANSIFSLSSTTVNTDSSVISRGVNLTAGNLATVSFYVSNFKTIATSTATSNFDVKWGTAQTLASQTNTIGTEAGYSSAAFTQKTYTFTPSTTGVYYFSIQNKSPINSQAGTHGILVDSFTVSQLLSSESFTLSGVTMYPNPATDILNIQSETEVLTKVSITDLNGRVVKEVSNNLSQISLENLAKGIYMVTIESATAKKVEKLIVE